MMPSGRSRTGRKIPKTPGSMAVFVDSTGMGVATGNRMAPRKAARMDSQFRNQRAKSRIAPMIQTAANTLGHHGVLACCTGIAINGAGGFAGIMPVVEPAFAAQLVWLVTHSRLFTRIGSKMEMKFMV